MMAYCGMIIKQLSDYPLVMHTADHRLFAMWQTFMLDQTLTNGFCLQAVHIYIPD